jgi:hypothetical protein
MDQHSAANTPKSTAIMVSEFSRQLPAQHLSTGPARREQQFRHGGRRGRCSGAGAHVSKRSDLNHSGRLFSVVMRHWNSPKTCSAGEVRNLVVALLPELLVGVQSQLEKWRIARPARLAGNIFNSARPNPRHQRLGTP